MVQKQCNQTTDWRDKKRLMSERRLDELNPGEGGRVVRIQGSSPIKRRLLEMGIVKGQQIVKVKLAPLADPAEYIVKGYHISLRRKEACDVIVRTADGQDVG
jgi:ferrous iron transport protein A